MQLMEQRIEFQWTMMSSVGLIYRLRGFPNHWARTNQAQQESIYKYSLLIYNKHTKEPTEHNEE